MVGCQQYGGAVPGSRPLHVSAHLTHSTVHEREVIEVAPAAGGELARLPVVDTRWTTPTWADLLASRGDWNVFAIAADGPHIEVRLNGVKTADLVDPDGARTGAISFQLASAVGQTCRAWFKNVYVEKIVRRGRK